MSRPKPWTWRRGLGRMPGTEHWALVDSRGRTRADVWSNGVWHTWDERGVGGENAECSDIDFAKDCALAAIVRQGWAVLVAAPAPQEEE